ncbi:MAG TPA: hypothetical protein VIH57_26420 [Bacteroidales bacterium]
METTILIKEKLINELNVSQELKYVCKKNGWDNLQTIVTVPVHILMKKPGMTSRLMAELYSFLKLNGIEEELIEE